VVNIDSELLPQGQLSGEEEGEILMRRRINILSVLKLKINDKIDLSLNTS